MSESSSVISERVVILMAVYNGSNYLREQLESLINQDFNEWSLLVLDDNSSDSSLDILKEYEQKDKRIHIVLNHRHFGNARDHFMALLQFAYQKKCYKYYLFCDQDDVWDSDKISKELKIANSVSNADKPLLVCTDLRVVDDQLNIISDSFAKYSNLSPHTSCFSNLLVENYVTGCTILINNALAKEADISMNSKRFIVMHDWWLGLIAEGLGTIVYIPEPTISYRQHGNNSMGAIPYSRYFYHIRDTWKKQCDSLVDSIHQAFSFSDVYGNKLTIDDKRSLSSFMKYISKSRLERLHAICFSHARKTGIPRNISLFFAVMFSNNINKSW